MTTGGVTPGLVGSGPVGSGRVGTGGVGTAGAGALGGGDSDFGGPSPDVPAAGRGESVGAVIARARLGRGISQLRLADLLCSASGQPTVTRHEVSRWEREERVPGSFWLGWLALVLEIPEETLATAVRRRRATAPPPTGWPAHTA